MPHDATAEDIRTTIRRAQTAIRRTAALIERTQQLLDESDRRLHEAEIRTADPAYVRSSTDPVVPAAPHAHVEAVRDDVQGVAEHTG